MNGLFRVCWKKDHDLHIGRVPLGCLSVIERNRQAIKFLLDSRRKRERDMVRRVALVNTVWKCREMNDDDDVDGDGEPKTKIAKKNNL